MRNEACKTTVKPSRGTLVPQAFLASTLEPHKLGFSLTPAEHSA